MRKLTLLMLVSLPLVGLSSLIYARLIVLPVILLIALAGRLCPSGTAVPVYALAMYVPSFAAEVTWGLVTGNPMGHGKRRATRQAA